MSKHKFYVYEYRDPRDNTPIYVGEGHGRRAYIHLKGKTNPGLATFIAELSALGLEPIIDKVAFFATKAEAWAREIELIALYGRLITGEGLLFNITKGGGSMDEEAMNLLWSNPEYRERRVELSRKQLLEIRNDPIFCEKQLESLRRMNTDPEFIKAKSERMRCRHKDDPKFVEKIRKSASTYMSKKNTDTNFRKINSDHMHKLRSDPAFLERAKAGKMAYHLAKRQSKS